MTAQDFQTESGTEQRRQSLCREAPVVVRVAVQSKGLMGMYEDNTPDFQDLGDLEGSDPRVFDMLENGARDDAVDTLAWDVLGQFMGVGDESLRPPPSHSPRRHTRPHEGPRRCGGCSPVPVAAAFQARSLVDGESGLALR